MKPSFPKYLFTNSKYFIYFLPVPILITMYWYFFQEGAESEMRWTYIGLSVVIVAIVAGNYVKWRKL